MFGAQRIGILVVAHTVTIIPAGRRLRKRVDSRGPGDMQGLVGKRVGVHRALPGVTVKIWEPWRKRPQIRQDCRLFKYLTTSPRSEHSCCPGIAGPVDLFVPVDYHCYHRQIDLLRKISCQLRWYIIYQDHDPRQLLVRARFFIPKSYQIHTSRFNSLLVLKSAAGIITLSRKTIRT